MNAAVVAAALLPRFFVMGDGKLAIVNAHTNERASVVYRRVDGSYDEGALKHLRHVFASNGGGDEIDIPLRLVEMLSAVQGMSKRRELVLVSGYRSPTYNKDLKAKGRKVAGGSMHTEGLAADLAFPRDVLRGLWLGVRQLDCCGAGYYAKEGFLHVDVGKSRFWEAATSRVDENLSAGNARVFARTEFDRYQVGETIVVTLHGITVPPVRIAREARVGEHVVRVEHSAEECFEVDGPAVRLRVMGAEAVARGTLALRTCEPRVERTPESVETGPIEVR
jgi:uncharacterized protein YcbK (DUF882 family)